MKWQWGIVSCRQRFRSRSCRYVVLNGHRGLCLEAWGENEIPVRMKEEVDQPKEWESRFMWVASHFQNKARKVSFIKTVLRNSRNSRNDGIESETTRQYTEAMTIYWLQMWQKAPTVRSRAVCQRGIRPGKTNKEEALLSFNLFYAFRSNVFVFSL